MKFWTLLFVLSLIAILGYSQDSYSNLSFHTNYVTNSTNPYCNTGLKLEVESNSIITVSFLQSLDSNYLDQRVQHRINSANFTITDSTLLWRRNGRSLFRDNFGFLPPNAGIVENLTIQTPANYFYECYTAKDSTMNFSFFSTHLGQKDSLVFIISLTGRFLKSEPKIYNNLLYFFTEMLNGDSAFITSYNLNGNQLNSLTSGTDSLGNPIVPFSLMRGPMLVSPSNSNRLIFENALTNRIDLFDINSFSITSSLELSWIDRIQLANSKRWGSTIALDYAHSSSGFSVCGILTKMIDLNDPNSIQYLKYYSIDLDWSGNLLRSEEFGPENIDSRAYGVEIQDSIKYIIGSTQFSSASIKAQEYRQVMLVRQSGVNRDSVLFFGNGNHVGLDVKVSGSNIFVLSENSNVWTNDSVFVNVTKIPKGVFTSVKKIDSKITSLTLYPNPTSQFIRFQNIKIGAEYKIFDMNGRVVDEGSVGNNSVNVERLKSATYFIQLYDQNNFLHRPIMFVKQ